MRVGSLFSGIGGLDLGLHRAGMEVVFQCESDAWRRGVLERRFPRAPCYEDVRLADRGGRSGKEPGVAEPPQDGGAIDYKGPGAVDLLCGGFPCQDVSVAGKRAGLQGERTGLFWEFCRVARSIRPPWLLLENVPGLLSSHEGRDFLAIVRALGELGYGVAWRILDSRYFGVPQRRRRVFILGSLVDGDPRAAAERAAEILAVGTRCERHPAKGKTAGAGVTSGSRVCALQNSGPHGSRREDEAAYVVATPLSHGSNPNSNMAGRRREDDENLVFGWNKSESQSMSVLRNETEALQASPQSNPAVMVGALREHIRPGSNTDHSIVQGVSVRRLTPTECERLQALPDGWTDLGPDIRRYAALGDAVTVNVAEWLGQRIRTVHGARQRGRENEAR